MTKEGNTTIDILKQKNLSYLSQIQLMKMMDMLEIDAWRLVGWYDENPLFVYIRNHSSLTGKHCIIDRSGAIMTKEQYLSEIIN